jgi:hypothetical protein
MKIGSTDELIDFENGIDSILELDLFWNLLQDDETFASITGVEYLFHEGSTDESCDSEMVSPPNGMADFVTTWENKATSSHIPLGHNDKPGSEFIFEWDIDPEQLEYSMTERSMRDHSANGEQMKRPGQVIFPLSSRKPRYL